MTAAGVAAFFAAMTLIWVGATMWTVGQIRHDQQTCRYMKSVPAHPGTFACSRTP